MTPEEETPQSKQGSRPFLGCGRMLLILFVLVGVALWMIFADFRHRERVHDSLRRAYQIRNLLENYAHDHDDRLPSSSTSSNEAFRELFKVGIMDDENLFYVHGCAWHAGKRPDGNIGSAENGFVEAVGKNENHFAYTTGLNQKTSPENTPIVMSGFTETPGIWCGDTSKKGGVWAGKYAFIVDLSGRARMIDLDADYRAMEWVNGERKNALDAVKLVPGAKLLNPDG